MKRGLGCLDEQLLLNANGLFIAIVANSYHEPVAVAETWTAKRGIGGTLYLNGDPRRLPVIPEIA